MSRLPTTLTPAEQDLSAIKHGDWTDREFPLGPREKPTRRQIIFKQSVLNEIYTHGRSAPDIEVCGVLVGNVYTDNIGPFVFIEASIRGNFSAGKNAQVTFTAQTWSHIQDVMDRQYPDMRILGWYHTHPGHGIFLSDMDLFIHKNFFSLPWHLAFVFDPQAQEEGLFAWRTGNMVVESFVVQKDVQPDTMKVARRVPEAPPMPIVPAPGGADEAGSEMPAEMPATASNAGQHAGGAYAAATAELKDLSLRMQAIERRQRWTTAGLALVVFLAIGWPVALAAYAVLHGATLPFLSNEPAPAKLGDTLTPPETARLNEAAAGAPTHSAAPGSSGNE